MRKEMIPPIDDPLPTRENICAVIVTYNPEPAVLSRSPLILPQVSRTIIVDNSTSPPERAEIRKLASSDARFDLIENGTNLGVGEALNIGARRAIELGARWVLFLDQDSIPHPNMAEILVGAYSQYPDRTQVKMIGSNYLFSNSNGTFDFLQTAETSPALEQKAVITSGSLLSTAAFEHAGLFRSDFFIDEVDHEYCLRLRKFGWKILITTEPTMHHEVGVLHVRVGRSMSEHSPLREYYIIRNRVAMVRAYWRSEPAWCLNHAVNTARHLGATFLFGIGDRSRNARAIARGAWDGIIGRMGKADERTF